MSELLLAVVRGAVALGCGAAAVVALTHLAVRRGRLGLFSWWARTVRGAAAPALRPIERRLLARGGNPQDAPYWLFGLALLGGLALVSLTQWSLGAVAYARYAARGGVRGVLALLVRAGATVLSVALVVRALGSWVGIGRWTRWMRPCYALTDWIVSPLQRVIPPIAGMDLSPVAAWILVQMAAGLLLGVIR